MHRLPKLFEALKLTDKDIEKLTGESKLENARQEKRKLKRIQEMASQGYNVSDVADDLNMSIVVINQFCKKHFKKTYGKIKNELVDLAGEMICKVCGEKMPLDKFIHAAGRRTNTCNRCFCAKNGMKFVEGKRFNKYQYDRNLEDYSGGWMNGNDDIYNW